MPMVIVNLIQSAYILVIVVARRPNFVKKSSTAEIALVGGRDAVQGHSRSPTCMLAPIESPYATSY